MKHKLFLILAFFVTFQQGYCWIYPEHRDIMILQLINSTLLTARHLNGIGESKLTLYGMTSKRTLSYYKHGHRIYFKKTELDDWINQGKVKTQAEIEAEASAYIIRRSRK